MKNIIAFSGTHGTSKSTCAYRFASDMKLKGHNIAVVDELARECPLKINKEAGTLTQHWIISAQMKREIELMDLYEYIICDRSIFDTLAYGVLLDVIQFDWDQMLQNYVKNYYHSIFVLDPDGFNYQISDGVRDMDPVFRKEVHETLIMLYNRYHVSYTLVKNESYLSGCLSKFM